MKALYLALGCTLCVLTASAQTTLELCQKLTREHYPLIRQYDLIRQSTDYSVSNAKRAWLPQVVLSSQATYQSDVMSYPAQFTALFAQMGYQLKGLNKDQYKIALEVNQSIWDGGQSAAQKRQAETEGAVNEKSLEVEMYALKERVNAIYFGILLLDEQLHQNELVREVLDSNQKKLEGLIRNGVATQSDMDAISVEILSSRQRETQLEFTREAYAKMLSLYTGEPAVALQKLVKPDVISLTNTQVRRLELNMFDAQKENLRAQQSGIEASVMPRVGAFAQGFYGNPGLNLFQDMMDNKWTWNYMVGIKLQWNFGGYYTRRNNVRKLEDAKQQIDLRREVFLFNTSLQTTQQESAIDKMKKVLADDDRIIVLRSSIRAAAEQRLNNGVADIHDVIREINAENLARVEKASHEIELLNKLYDLKNTVNQ